MVTTIQISEDLQNELTKRKLYDRETYEDVIWDLLEDTLEISEETKMLLNKAEEEVRVGKIHTHEQVKKELEL